MPIKGHRGIYVITAESEVSMASTEADAGEGK